MFKRLLTRKSHRRAGDAARQRGDWKAAEESYRRHLSTVPNDDAIWVQLGHAAKEQGRFEEAATFYGRAVDLSPSDEDTWLHLAHALLRDGKKPAALAAFEQSHRLSRNRESFDYAILLGAKRITSPAPDRSVKTLLLVDDLFTFLTHNVTLSGIQRVQVGIIAGLLDKDPTSYGFLLMSSKPHYPVVTFWEVPAGRIKAIVDYVASGAGLERGILDGFLQEANKESLHAVFKAGDVVFIMGAFWIIQRTAATLATLKAADVKIGVYIYDLIPISHPEFCHPLLVEEFARSFAELVQFVDFFATISEYVAQVLASFLDTHELRKIPITPIPLAHFLTIPNIDQAASENFIQDLPVRIKEGPYALYVSTIEGRKNHLYVLNVWQELLRQGVDMPDLVFLGRKGWRIEGLMSFLDGTRNLNGKVHFLHDIGDGDLAYLYRNCAFTLFTSIVEGWGLPVGESLVFGKPCVASDNCSIPEVGGDLIDYIDPMNVRTGISVVERLVTDHDYREQRTHQIADTFKPRSWSNVAEDFIRLIERVNSSPSLKVAPFTIPPLKNYSFVWKEFDVFDLSNLLQFPNRLVLSDDFYDQERGQVWMRGSSGIINIPTILPQGATATIAVSLALAPWLSKCLLSLSSSDVDEATCRRAAQAVVEPTGTPLLATVPVSVGAHGMASIMIRLFDPPPHIESDGREFYVGVRSIAYQETDHLSDKRTILACFINQESFDFQ